MTASPGRLYDVSSIEVFGIVRESPALLGNFRRLKFEPGVGLRIQATFDPTHRFCHRALLNCRLRFSSESAGRGWVHQPKNAALSWLNHLRRKLFWLVGALQHSLKRGRFFDSVNQE